MKHVKVSFDPLRRMDTATRKIIAEMKNYAARRDAIRQSYRDSGTFGCSAMTAELELLRQTSKARTAPHRFEIESAYQDFTHALDDVMLPDGRSIDVGDAALLEHNLLRTTSELRALQRRYEGNTAMLRMIDDYAKRHKWDGFESYKFDDAHYLREFAEDRLDMARAIADGYEGQTVNYNASYFEKHLDAEADYKEWAGDRIRF